MTTRQSKIVARIFSALTGTALLSTLIGFAPEAQAQAVYKLITQGKYAQAYPAIKAQARSNPRDVPTQYYLGLCAMGLKDFGAADLAFSHVIVGSPKDSPWAANAFKSLTNIQSKSKPYSCVINGRTHRWSPAAQPLKVYISDGRGLNANLAGRDLGETEITQVNNMLSNVDSMPVAPSYRPTFKRAVIDGMQYWTWANKSGLVKYALAGAPNGADIVVLFSDSCSGGKTGFTALPASAGNRCLVQISCNTGESTELNAFNAVRLAAAKEFGHSMGLGSSSEQTDLMYENTQNPQAKGAAQVSASDLATLRALYSMGTDVVMTSAR
ncbi:MAG: matrixin family metalloprotease [Candidatus Obscuribacter sp.]|nr:matrixin family metalloprotease [Candidatus Obscuribacter sp.]